MSDAEKRIVEKLKTKERLRVAALYLKNTGEIEAFVAGVAACATRVFNSAVTARDVEKCLVGVSDAEGYFGGAAIVLEGLDDIGVVTALEREGMPTIYPATRKVSINMLIRGTWAADNFGIKIDKSSGKILEQ